MAKIDEKYNDLLKEIQSKGYSYKDPNRKGIIRKQISSYTIEHDFKDGFPAITTKKLAWKSVVGELLWILRGDTNIKYLVDNGINIWNKDAYNYYNKHYNPNNFINYKEWLKMIKSTPKNKYGDIGRGYGAQLRNWSKLDNSILNLKEGEEIDFTNSTLNISSEVDQLVELINTLKTNPMATKKTVTFWNPAEKDQCALTPCHWSFEILVEPLNERVCLDGGTQQYQFTLKWHQHSVDTFLGLPFNIASYALLAQIIGEMTNMIPKGIIGDLSNVHIYKPHMDAVKEQLSRDVDKYGECELNINNNVCVDIKKYPNNLDLFLDRLNISDFTLNNYKSYSRIPAEMLAYSD